MIGLADTDAVAYWSVARDLVVLHMLGWPWKMGLGLSELSCRKPAFSLNLSPKQVKCLWHCAYAEGAIQFRLVPAVVF